MKKYLRALAFALTLGGCSCQNVDPGNVGVETDWGHITGKTYGEGTHVTGWSTDLHEMSIRLQNLEEQDIPCRSNDNVRISVDITVQYSLNRKYASEVFRKLGDNYADVLIKPSARSAVRDGVASVAALEVAQSREELETKVTTAVRQTVIATLRQQSLNTDSVHIASVQLRNVDLPRTLTASIEAVQQQRNQTLQSEQALLTARQEAERSRAIAQGQNEVAILEAQRNAEVRRINAESEAAYNRMVSQSITSQLVELRRIEAQRAIVSNPNAHLVVLGGGGGGSMPIVLPPMSVGQ